jgi:hypothetical protein
MGFKLQHTISETGVVGEYWHEMSLVYDIPEGTQPELAQAGKAFLLGYIRALPEFAGSENA